MKVLIVIPAYNEEKNLPGVISNLKAHAKDGWDWIVVNDGSSDGTAAWCRSNNVPLLDSAVNLGLAGTFQTGMRYGYMSDYDYVLQFDGDGQHDAAYINSMLNCAVENDADIVIGSRFVTEKKPHTLRMVGSTLLTAMIHLFSGRKLTDPTSGMRLYGQRVIKRFALHANMGPEPDTIAYMLMCGARIHEVQVSMHERVYGKSYLSLARSAKYMLQMFISIILIQKFRERTL